jgi:nitrite reductase/ring-hydroxylating ferredoxin subunit
VSEQVADGSKEQPVAGWVKVADLSELTRRRRMAVQVGDQEIALFLVGEKVYALADICIHKQRNLSKGTVFNGKVVCPGHQWTFDLETGYECDQDEFQPTYDVKIEDGGVHVVPVCRALSDMPASAG